MNWLMIVAISLVIGGLGGVVIVVLLAKYASREVVKGLWK